jgi:hypothetical protein
MTTKQRIRYVTPIGTVLFARLKTPSVKYSETGRYSVTLLLSPQESQDFIKVIEEVSEAFKHETLTKKTLNRTDPPYTAYIPRSDVKRPGDDEMEGAYLFKFFLNAYVKPSNKPAFTQRPALFDAKGKPMNEEIWAGSRLRVASEINPWQTNLAWGVSLWVKAAQVIYLVNGQNACKDGPSYGFGEEEGYESFPDESVYENPNDAIPF